MSTSSRTMRVLADAEVVVSWARDESKVFTVGDLLALGPDPEGMPKQVSDAWRELVRLPLSEVTNFTRKVGVAALVETLLSGLPKARLSVFKNRNLALDPPSLEKIGLQMRVTRERIRQLENAAQEAIEAALKQPRFKVLHWRAKALADSLGSAMPTDHSILNEALQEVGGSGNLDDVADRFLLWLGGPYKEKHGWLVRSGTVVPQECNRLLAFADEFGVIGTSEKTMALLSEMGLRREVHDEWLKDCRYIRLFRGTAIVSKGSVADKAVPIMAILGESQTPGRLAELVEEGHSPMTVRNTVYKDPRFVRTSKNEFGLSAWGDDEFPTERRGHNGTPVLA